MNIKVFYFFILHIYLEVKENTIFGAEHICSIMIGDKNEKIL